MTQSCTSCHRQNRPKARFCKTCGSPLQNTEDLLGNLIGLEHIRETLSELKHTIEGMRRQNVPVQVAFNTLVIGNSGTAKSMIGDLVAQLLHSQGLSKTPHATTLDARHRDTIKTIDLTTTFEQAKGGVLFVDNLHVLTKEPTKEDPLLLHLGALMEKSPADPVVICAGHRFGLSEFVQRDQNKGFTGNFQHIFEIADYDAAHMTEIAKAMLTREGFTLDDAAESKLEKRFVWLFRETRKPDHKINASNGKLVQKEVAAIRNEYFRRPTAVDRMIVAEDIADDIEVSRSLDEILAQLDGYIGMDNIKQEIHELHTMIANAQANSASFGKHFEVPVPHIIITGNPGTGKTSIARDLGAVFHGLGVLSSGHVIEVDRSKLVAGFIGQTAPLVNAECDKAMGGILFIDEAYTLRQDDNDKFGEEAINTLLKRMEDARGKFIVIVAGYQQRMPEFLNANSGLPSRFNKTFHIEDYTPEEMGQIFAQCVRQKGYQPTPEAVAAATTHFLADLPRRDDKFANGRTARNFADECLRNLSKRVLSTTPPMKPDDRLILTVNDIPTPDTVSPVMNVDTALQQLDRLVGLPKVKAAVRKLHSSITARRLLNNNDLLSRHFLFIGPPGTGKTSVARILADIFHAIGLLPTNTLIEADRGTLVSNVVGGTAPKTNQVCDSAMGGVLLIDEAYSLCQGQGGNDLGPEAVATLLKRLEDDRGKFVAILTGYEQEMSVFLDSNSGLPSRFSDYIEFEDYTPDEMVEIFKSMQFSKGISSTAEFDAALIERMRNLHAQRTPNFANARTVRQVFEKTEENCLDRGHRIEGDEATKRREMRCFQPADLDQTIQG